MLYHTFSRQVIYVISNGCMCQSIEIKTLLDCKGLRQRLSIVIFSQSGQRHKCHDLCFAMSRIAISSSNIHVSDIDIGFLLSSKNSIRNFFVDILQTMKFSRGRGASSVAGRSHTYKFISLPYFSLRCMLKY